ncbi:GerAB/ArcD/ProY family transporter [Paenibacillus sacheonensis]|uniref:GerAB/ArcD/ProY family transporter n=1 Tax=Paenibacillus sacheonensis TaxID=742054 RepID=A0A7X4YLA5_9BACL|nr:GerAB/ArcD/ProY family transporter [Paenibacillus sacheonensis]MBM7568802.1 spore germination protein KB [Paenibacillus sacheonensis]NBC68367.1 GerAB/ArcD/ProY family transporter [Paenibacillus sacheonensis]
MKAITPLQIYMMSTQFLFSTAIGFFIGPLVLKAGFMSWISVILGSGIGLAMTYLSFRLMQRRPEEFLAHYGMHIVGRWPHYIIFACVLLIHLYMAAFVLRELSDFIIQIYLPGTPEWAVVSLFGLCIARGVRSGPVHFFRSAQGLFLFSVISVFTFPLFVSSEVDTEKLIAFVTDFHPGGIWDGTLISSALFSETAFIVYLIPYFRNKERTFRMVAWSALTAAFVTIANIVATLMLFGSELTANLTYPTLEMIRYIWAGSFLENLDPLLIVFWLFSMLLKIGLFLMMGTLITAHLFGLKDHKPFSYGMAAAMIVLSIAMFESTADIEESTTQSQSILLLLKSSVPLLYLLVDSLRAWKGRKLAGQAD